MEACPAFAFGARRLFLFAMLLAVPVDAGELRFRHHLVDRDLPADQWGQTALADLDGDGDLDFITGRSRGIVRWYERRKADDWIHHPITGRSPSEVGGAAGDVDGDGRIDFVAGGAWFVNPGDPKAAGWEAHVFDAVLGAVHDLVLADIDGDRRPDVVTMSDQNDLRWYRIAEKPAEPWKMTRIGSPIHAGAAAGDVDRDGDIDVVRGVVWFENEERGARWTEHAIAGIPWSDVEGAFRGSTKSWVGDLNKDGRPEIVLTEAEIQGARIAWFEGPQEPKKGPWKPAILPHSDDERRGPYHSLAVADFDLDGDLDIFSGEMEHLARPPHRWFLWENGGGEAPRFTERVILDAGLGTHEAVAGDVDGDGDIDILGKLWKPVPDNANGGRNHVDFLENLLREPKAAKR
jgi:hypothetical protein